MTRNVYGRNEPSRQELATPRWLIEKLEAKGLSLYLDVCANPETSVCRRYFTTCEDGLRKEWHVEGGTWAWCNPPFSAVEPWVAKAYAEHALRGTRTVMLLPFKAETRWFQQYAPPMVHLLTPRLNYWDPSTRSLLRGVSFASCLWLIDLPLKVGNPLGVGKGDFVLSYLHCPRPKGAVR